MSKDAYKVAIIGIGPVGGILGAYLQKKGIDVTLVDIWKPHIEAIRKNGLLISGAATINANFDEDHLKTSTADLKNTEVNLIFIAVKTPFLERVIFDLQDVISDEALIVSHQNGAGPEDLIAQTFGKERTFRDIINYAGNIIDLGKIDMTFFNPPNYIGAVTSASSSKAQSIAEFISLPEFPTEYIENIQPEVWTKVILNASLSPVCAITNQTMKEAMDFPYTFNLASNIIKEGIEVCKAIGVNFSPDFHDTCISYLRKGGHHRPSMLIDVENKR